MGTPPPDPAGPLPQATLASPYLHEPPLPLLPYTESHTRAPVRHAQGYRTPQHPWVRPLHSLSLQGPEQPDTGLSAETKHRPHSALSLSGLCTRLEMPHTHAKLAARPVPA